MVYRLPKLKISNGRCQAIGPSYIGSSQGSLLGPVLFVLFIEKLLCVYEEKGLDEVILDKLTWDPHLRLWTDTSVITGPKRGKVLIGSNILNQALVPRNNKSSSVKKR